MKKFIQINGDVIINTDEISAISREDAEIAGDEGAIISVILQNGREVSADIVGLDDADQKWEEIQKLLL